MGKLLLVFALASTIAVVLAPRASASTDAEAQKRVEMEDKIESAKHMIRAGWYSFALTYLVNIVSGLVILNSMGECEDDKCVEGSRIVGGTSLIPVATTFFYGTMVYAAYPDPITFAVCFFGILHALGQAACLAVAIAGHIYLRVLKKEHAKFSKATWAAGPSAPRMALVPVAVQGGAGLSLAGSF